MPQRLPPVACPQAGLREPAVDAPAINQGVVHLLDATHAVEDIAHVERCIHDVQPVSDEPAFGRRRRSEP
jgi:hypothetical protein